MFTIPAAGSGGIILVARPSASSGTITDPSNAYDLPSSRPDDPPYSTSADKAIITGSSLAGTFDTDTVEYNTFPSRSKTTFSSCDIVIGFDVSITQIVSPYSVGASLVIQYQVDGSNWLSLFNSGKPAIDYIEISGGPPAFTRQVAELTKTTRSITIPSSNFPSNLNSLKIRFVASTLTESTGVYSSTVSYKVWDIRANIS
jgi:hypothetical protein